MYVNLESIATFLQAIIVSVGKCLYDSSSGASLSSLLTKPIWGPGAGQGTIDDPKHHVIIYYVEYEIANQKGR